MNELLAFLGVAALVIVTPGQDTALTIRNVLVGGRRAGIATTAGVCAGQATWAAATAMGLSALLVASQPAFAALKLAGAAYLLYLGGRALVEAFKPAARTRGPSRATAHGRLTSAGPFRQGLLSNLANPKMLAFFASLLPQFGHDGAQLLALGLLFCSMTFAWLAAYSFVVARLGDVLRGGRIRRAIEAMTGTVLLAFGARLATEPA